MSWMEEVRTGIESIAKNAILQVRVFDATVVSVSEETRTCIVESEKDNIQDLEVRLMPEVSDGELSIPEVDSTVMVVFTGITKPFITNTSWITKKLIIVGEQGWLIEPSKQTLNDGAFGGLVKVEPLTEQINRVENKLNDLISKFNAHTHELVLAGCAAGSGGVGTSVPPTNVETSIPDTTDRSLLENTSIIHGETL